MSQTITIPIGEFKRLVRNTILLNTLESKGVDNWEGYEEAYSSYLDELELEEDTNERRS